MLNFETRGKDRPASLNGVSRSKVPPPVVVLSPTQQLERWLDRARSEVFTVNTTLTPDMARVLLDRNPENRAVGTRGPNRSVAAYAEMMRRGEWLLNGSTIVVSRDGFLNDGQHRCHAVIEAGVSIPVLISFGVERESRITVDQGRARTPGDVLSIHGQTNTNILAKAIQFVWAYDGPHGFRDRPSPAELLSTLEDHPHLSVAICEATKLGGEFRLSRGYISGAHYVCSRFDGAKAAEFLDLAATGLNITSQSSPIYRLRKRYEDHAREGKLGRIDAIEQAAIYIKAFNAFLRGRNIALLRWRQHGDAAEQFPNVGM